MDQRDEWIGLRIFSPESNTWKSTEALNQGDRSRRFADPNGEEDLWITFMEGCSKIGSAISGELWEGNYGRLIFSSEILWNKQMDR